MATRVHPTAVVDPSAELADGVVVGPHAIVGARVVIGEGTEIGAGAQVHGPTRLGSANRIFPLAAIGFEPQDLKFGGEDVFLEVGDGNQIREFCTVNRGTGKGGGTTRIGNDNLFMAYAHVAHDCQVGSRTIFVNNATLGGHVDVEDDATIGAFSSVHQFCRVGRHAYIGGYSVITMDALPYLKTVGQKPLCYGVNSIGLKRKGLDEEAVARLSKAVRLFLRSGLNVGDALSELKREWSDDPNIAHFIAFVESSKRGVIKGLPGKKRSARGGGAGAQEEAGDA